MLSRIRQSCKSLLCRRSRRTGWYQQHRTRGTRYTLRGDRKYRLFPVWGDFVNLAVRRRAGVKVSLAIGCQGGDIEFRRVVKKTALACWSDLEDPAFMAGTEIDVPRSIGSTGPNIGFFGVIDETECRSEHDGPVLCYGHSSSITLDHVFLFGDFPEDRANG